TSTPATVTPARIRPDEALTRAVAATLMVASSSRVRPTTTAIRCQPDSPSGRFQPGSRISGTFICLVPPKRHRRRTGTLPGRRDEQTDKLGQNPRLVIPRDASEPAPARVPSYRIRARSTSTVGVRGRIVIERSAARLGPELPGQAVEQLAVDAAQAPRGEGALEDPADPAPPPPDGGKVQVGGGGAGRGAHDPGGDQRGTAVALDQGDPRGRLGHLHPVGPLPPARPQPVGHQRARAGPAPLHV